MDRWVAGYAGRWVAGYAGRWVASGGGARMKAARRADPFAALGLPSGPGLTDEEVRAAWRRVATATHPDREDGGDPARFAAAAAAYTALRTPFGRSEALADLAGHPPALPRSWGRAGHGRRPGRERRGPGRERRTPEWTAGRGRLARQAGLALGRWWSRVRRGRPARLALRVVVAAGACAGVAVVAGARPATPALVTGAVTWLVLTARHDLAPPR